MRQVHVHLALFALVGPWVVLQPPPAMADETNEQRIMQALERRDSVSLEEKTILQLADYLKDRIGAPVFVDRNALHDVGVDPDKTRVSWKFEGISLYSALRHLLRDLLLTWTIRDGAMVITTPEKAEEQLLTEVYEVRDLLLPPRSVREDLSRRYFDSRSLRDESSWYDCETLINVVKALIRPADWDTVGGPGAMEAFGHTLAVSQTREVHRQIKHLLAAIRQARKLSGKYRRQAPPVVSIALDVQSSGPVHKALQTKVDFDFADTPLKDVASFLRERLGVPVLSDKGALDAMGVGGVTPMRFTSRGLTASQSLRHLLRDLGVTWIVRDEALVITAPEKAEEDQEIRVYPVADLVCDSDPCGQLVPNDGKDFSTLIDLIESTISPDSWESVGGPGSIEPCRNADVLAVSAGPQTHEEIEHLLTRLRAEMAPQPTEPAKSTKETASSGAARSAARAADEDRDGAAAEKDLRFVVYFVPSPADWPPKAPQIESEKKEAKPADGASPQTEKKEAKPDDRAAPAPGAPKSSQPSPNLWNMGGLGGGTGLRGLQSPPIPEGRLLEMIRELVEPNSWAATRGVYARAAPGRLIIRHTAAVHRQIHALLSQLAIKFHTSAGFSSDDAGRTGGFQGPTAWFDAQLPPTGP